MDWFDSNIKNAKILFFDVVASPNEKVYIPVIKMQDKKA